MCRVDGSAIGAQADEPPIRRQPPVGQLTLQLFHAIRAETQRRIHGAQDFHARKIAQGISGQKQHFRDVESLSIPEVGRKGHRRLDGGVEPVHQGGGREFTGQVHFRLDPRIAGNQTGLAGTAIAPQHQMHFHLKRLGDGGGHHVLRHQIAQVPPVLYADQGLDAIVLIARDFPNGVGGVSPGLVDRDERPVGRWNMERLRCHRTPMNIV